MRIEWIVVLAPRLSSRVGFPPIGEKWKDTVVDLPDWAVSRAAKDLFTGRELPLTAGQIRLSDACRFCPSAAIAKPGSWRIAPEFGSSKRLLSAPRLEALGQDQLTSLREIARCSDQIGAETGESDLRRSENQHRAKQKQVHQINHDERKESCRARSGRSGFSESSSR